MMKFFRLWFAFVAFLAVTITGFWIYLIVRILNYFM